MKVALRFFVVLLSMALASALLGRSAIAQDRQTAQSEHLLDALASASDATEAEAIEARIIAAWSQSGSDTVDLLMQWAAAAMKDKDYALAIDLLNEVVALEPGYAEGWNKRATVFYLIDEYALSMADIHQVLALEPRHFGALSGMGLIFNETGDKRHALEAFRSALSVHPFLENAQKAVDELVRDVEGDDI